MFCGFCVPPIFDCTSSAMDFSAGLALRDLLMALMYMAVATTNVPASKEERGERGGEEETVLQ